MNTKLEDLIVTKVMLSLAEDKFKANGVRVHFVILTINQFESNLI